MRRLPGTAWHSGYGFQLAQMTPQSRSLEVSCHTLCLDTKSTGGYCCETHTQQKRRNQNEERIWKSFFKNIGSNKNKEAKIDNKDFLKLFNPSHRPRSYQVEIKFNNHKQKKKKKKQKKKKEVKSGDLSLKTANSY